jgi:hypothetical protein
MGNGKADGFFATGEMQRRNYCLEGRRSQEWWMSILAGRMIARMVDGPFLPGG